MNDTDRLFNSLKIPDDVFNPVRALSGRVGDWNVILSPRARGKTTNLLLWGMCENWTKGAVIQYIRQYDDMLTPTQINNLFEVILQFGYIEKITDGKYNSCKYTRRRWYYTRVDDSGEEVERANEPFMVCLAINREHDYRSTYNAPKGDFIIVDEWMRADKMYMRDEFVLLSNLLSTIIRDRVTARIFMIANLVDITCPYLTEMGIHEIVRVMTFGEFKQIKVDDTVISILLIAAEKHKSKAKNKYFGVWQNAKMTGITGAKGVWALKIYPRAPHDKEYEIIDKAQIQVADGFICREIRKYDDGLYIMFYPLYAPLDNRVTYTWDTSQSFGTLRRYGLGYTLTDETMKELLKRKKCYFSDNATGERVDAFLKKIN